MRRWLFAATILAAAPALAHTRSTDPVPMATPARTAIVCAGQDATSAIQAGLQAPGSTVQLSAGTCAVSAALAMASLSTLAGAGQGATILLATGSGYDLVDFGTGRLSQAVTGATLAHLTLDGRATAIGATMAGSDAVIKIGSSRNFLLDVEAEHAADSGVRIAGSGNTLSGSSIHDNEANGVTVMGTRAADGTARWADGNRIVGNVVRSNSLAHPQPPTGPGSTWDWIDIDSLASNTLVQGNDLTGDVLVRNPFPADPAVGNQVLGNTIHDTQVACIIVSDAESGVVVSDNALVNCWHYAVDVGGSATSGEPEGTLSGNAITGTAPIVLHLGTAVNSTGNTRQP